MKPQRIAACLTLALAARLAHAQSFVLDLPLRSQQAEVSQRLGLTDIDIRYHRPLVAGRKIWGELVPYGKVWRTGANAITTITFGDPVTVEGRPLDRGTYGLHAIPAPDEWTLIFSKASTTWGSFTYDPAEDALRIQVKPEPAPMHEALTFEFDHLQPDSAVVALEWENLRVAFRVAADVHAIAQASLKRQLRALARYTWMSWDDAASYLLRENIALDDALAYANKSIELEDRFDNELTKSKVLTALNRPAEAATAQHRALDLGTPTQVHDFAVALLKTNRDEAFTILRDNARKHPTDWIAHEGLARIYSAQGKFADAAKELKLALASAPEGEKTALTEMLARVGAGREVNE